ncbi:hypothetical protein B0H11DRAFT_1908288 [Mycena galericulata]|nr:hypothetical protein B0H11DRAFT_1908288 [Mycena galericulata]
MAVRKQIALFQRVNKVPNSKSHTEPMNGGCINGWLIISLPDMKVSRAEKPDVQPGRLGETTSAGKVRFGSGSGAFSPNAEPEPRVRFIKLVNLEPEPAFSLPSKSVNEVENNIFVGFKTPQKCIRLLVRFGFEPISEPDLATTRNNYALGRCLSICTQDRLCFRHGHL